MFSDTRGMVAIRGRLLRWSDREMRWVVGMVRSTRHKPLHLLAHGVSWLGNGGIYLLLGGAVLGLLGRAAWPVAVAAGVSAAACHLIYPALKRAFSRPRPFAHRTGLVAAATPPLDEHSFPSGHAMTLSAVLLPIAAAVPTLTVEAVAIWLLMAWARLACAHHYPSDVLAGTLIGAGIAALPAMWLLGAFS